MRQGLILAREGGMLARLDQATTKGICLGASPTNWVSSSLQAKQCCQVEH